MSENLNAEHPYEELALMAFSHSMQLIKQSKKAYESNTNYLRAVKNAAYAWRQAIFFISLSPDETVDATIRKAEEQYLATLGQDVTHKLFKRLKIVLRGEQMSEDALPFLGWTSKPHWLIGQYKKLNDANRA